jgi:O-antigen/teichoic acid export membrane protein
MEEQKSGRTIRGTFLLMCSSVVIVLFSAISQIALGWLLSDNDFGVYAIAIGVVAVSQILRDGGVTVWLARCDQETFDKEKESAFGLTVLCSLVIAVGLILFSQPAVMIYKDERLSSLLIVLAMGIVTMGVGAVPFAKLQIQGKLNEIAMIGIASGFIRFLGPIPLALLGFGPMSIAIAVAVSGLIRLVLLMKTADYYPTTLKISIPKAGEFLKTTKWALLGSFVTTLFWQLDYLILGTSVSLAIVGSYYFAYQICSQVVNIATMALNSIGQ